jgi:phosphoribosyl 1,2-cyclic phosphate phosphodiesterase
VPHIFRTTDIRGRFILLGTGTSVGVPVIGCGCDVCTSSDSRNKRTRAAALVGLPGGNLLIDTPPELRLQLVREGVGVVHAVLFTHEHADHIFGLDDLRLFPFVLGTPVPLYCEASVENRLRHSFDYAFTQITHTHPGATPQLEFRRIGLEPEQILGATVQPLRMEHGPRFQVLGFRFGNVAYCTDTSFIPEASYEVLAGVEYLIIDALRYQPHPTHFHVDAALAAIERVGPRRAYLTHVSHELEYTEMLTKLPKGVELAYDGLSLPLELSL